MNSYDERCNNKIDSESMAINFDFFFFLRKQRVTNFEGTGDLVMVGEAVVAALHADDACKLVSF